MIRPKLISAALLFVTAGSMTSSASAITVELAKKCGALTRKAFPPRVIGNPAAGSAKGSGVDAQAYFNASSGESVGGFPWGAMESALPGHSDHSSRLRLWACGQRFFSVVHMSTG